MAVLSKTTYVVALLLLAPMVHARSAYVTMSFDHLTLSEAVAELIDQTGLTFGIPPGFDRPGGHDVRLNDVPVSIALDVFAAVYQVCLMQTDEVVSIRPCKTDRPMPETDKVRQLTMRWSGP